MASEARQRTRVRRRARERVFEGMRRRGSTFRNINMRRSLMLAPIVQVSLHRLVKKNAENQLFQGRC